MKETIELASEVKIQVGETWSAILETSKESEINGCNHTAYIQISGDESVDRRAVIDSLSHCADSIHAIARKLRQDCEIYPRSQEESDKVYGAIG